MRYVRVNKILPENLIKEIQKYIQGEYIYIPSCPETRKRWGEKSKNRDYFKNRNLKIQSKYIDGKSISDLAKEFFLSESSIKKIVYKRDK
ncbi:CD3324 family protein [Clostridium hydrogeniformans]|uniref:CD3324 family protein n=1 Tax=Clostridium hydrogeniformans TaxID=349933 RepID=UPI000481852A|nr:CD3324 family protein [Clostridium hydrogeniformans]